MPEVSVKTIKGFNNDGVYAKRGSTITVDEHRARELHLNGLIEDYGAKSASAPENKMALDPNNKEEEDPPPPPPAPPVLSLKQEGHGKWIVVDESDKQVGEFVGNKADAQKELDRLVAAATPVQE